MNPQTSMPVSETSTWVCTTSGVSAQAGAPGPTPATRLTRPVVATTRAARLVMGRVSQVLLEIGCESDMVGSSPRVPDQWGR